MHCQNDLLFLMFQVDLAVMKVLSIKYYFFVLNLNFCGLVSFSCMGPKAVMWSGNTNFYLYMETRSDKKISYSI